MILKLAVSDCSGVLISKTARRSFNLLRVSSEILTLNTAQVQGWSISCGSGLGVFGTTAAYFWPIPPSRQTPGSEAVILQ